MSKLFNIVLNRIKTCLDTHCHIAFVDCYCWKFMNKIFSAVFEFIQQFDQLWRQFSFVVRLKENCYYQLSKEKELNLRIVYFCFYFNIARICHQSNLWFCFNILQGFVKKPIGFVVRLKENVYYQLSKEKELNL